MNREIRVKDGYSHFQFHYIPKCGDKKCELPIVEIGASKERQGLKTARPKLLITAGLEGTDQVAISAVMNLIKYVGKKRIM